MDQLHVIQATGAASDDFELVSTLVGKLHQDYQEDWDKFVVATRGSSPIWTLFREFLSEKYQGAIQSRLRYMAEKSDSSSNSNCIKCNSRHKPDQRCRNKPVESWRNRRQASDNLDVVHANLNLAKVTTRAELKEYTAETKKKYGPCPCCSKFHSFEREFSFGKGDVPSNRLHQCPYFVKKSVKDRALFVEKVKGCYACLSTGHQGEDCR